MKTRIAWKVWSKNEPSERLAEAIHTIDVRTRRYYRNKAREAFKKGNMMSYKFCSHKAEWPFLMEDVLFKDGYEYIRAGKSYHIW